MTFKLPSPSPFPSVELSRQNPTSFIATIKIPALAQDSCNTTLYLKISRTNLESQLWQTKKYLAAAFGPCWPSPSSLELHPLSYYLLSWGSCPVRQGYLPITSNRVASCSSNLTVPSASFSGSLLLTSLLPSFATRPSTYTTTNALFAYIHRLTAVQLSLLRPTS